MKKIWIFVIIFGFLIILFSVLLGKPNSISLTPTFPFISLSWSSPPSSVYTNNNETSKGIVANGGSNIYIGNNTIVGFDIGIDAENVTNLTTVNNNIK